MPRLTAAARRDIVQDFLEHNVWRDGDSPLGDSICDRAHAELRTMRMFKAELAVGKPLVLADQKKLAAEYRRSLRDTVESFCESARGGKFAGLYARRLTRRR